MASKYCIAWEDPDEPDAPVRVAHPAPQFLLGMKLLGYTEEQAMEVLVAKDIPRHVWDRPPGNRSYFAIMLRDHLPADRAYRNAWRLAS